MFKKRKASKTQDLTDFSRKVTSVLSSKTVVNGQLSGQGGIRIEGAFEGEVNFRGLIVIGEKGRVTCEHVRAYEVIVAGILKGDVIAEKVEIRATGKIWGDVVTKAFSSAEGAFLKGQIRIEEELDIGLGPDEPESEPLPETP